MISLPLFISVIFLKLTPKIDNLLVQIRTLKKEVVKLLWTCEGGFAVTLNLC